MLLPEKMYRITVIGLKERMRDVINYLYKMAVMHLEKEEKIGKEMTLKEDESNALTLYTKVNSLFLNLKKIIKLEEPSSMRGVKEEELKEGERILELFSDYFQKLEKLKKEFEELKEEKEIVDLLIKMDVSDLGDVKEIQEHDVIIGMLSRENLPYFKELVKKLKKQHFVRAYIKEKEDGVYVLLISTKDNPKIGDVLSLLKKHYYLPNIYEKFKEKHLKVNDLYFYVLDSINNIEEEINTTLNNIKELYEKNKRFLWDLKYTLMDKVNMIKGYKFLKESEYVYVIKGYLPSNKLKKVMKGIKRVDPHAIIRVEEIHQEHNAPVNLKYPKILKGMHLLLDVYGLPAYRYIDPSSLMLISFPLFYGFILGDVGYGLALLLLSLIIKRFVKSEGIKLLSNILIISSLSTIFFGFLFGEFFGMEEIFGFHLSPILHRMHDIKSLMGISILLGILHINIGLVLGIAQEVYYKRYLSALTHKFSWILLQISLGLLGYGYWKHISWGVYSGWVLFLLSIIMIYSAEKLSGIFELPTIFSNILSYLRLGAVGLSSVAIAYVINKFVDLIVAHHSIGGYIGGISLFLIGHVFNLTLGVIDSFLHTLRLHYVEFFTKFYKSGGIKYTPYGNIKKV